MPPSAITKSDELLFLCASEMTDQKTLSQIKALLSAAIDWNYFTEKTMSAKLSFSVERALTSAGALSVMPKEYRQELQATNLYVERKVTRQCTEISALLRLFAQNNIPVVPLKGPLLAERLYGNTAARSLSSDIDLLIIEIDRAQAHGILERAGYIFQKACSPETATWQDSFTKDNSIIDLHFKIMASANTTIMNFFWDQSRPVTSKENVNWYEPNEEALLIHLIGHCTRTRGLHLTELRCLRDINMILVKYGRTLNWPKLAADTKSFGLSRSLYATIILCRCIFNTVIPESAMQALRPSFCKRILIHAFFTRTLFSGEKSKRRLMLQSDLAYSFVALLEAASLYEHWKILFPPRERIMNTNYAKRIYQAILKIFKFLTS